MFTSFLFISVCFLAYANGANDNFKGVASLFGSGTLSYRMALAWATLTTLAGSIAALFLAQTLMIKFSGKGLAPDELIHSLPFMIAVAGGLNDTPKIAALLLLAPGVDRQWIIITVALSMLLGGVFNARKVAETMSHKITTNN